MSAPSSADRRQQARRAAREAARQAGVDAGADSERAERAAAVGRGHRAGGGHDPLGGALRRAGLVRMLVLRLLDDAEPAYGNRLIERIRDLTAGLVAVNPNTMYPLLRSLEEEGLAVGEWEHPVRRSRRFYRITDAGRAEQARLRDEVVPALDEVEAAVAALRATLGD